MKSINKWVVLVFVLSFGILLSQEKYNISGVVMDAKTNETIIGATVFVPEANAQIVTNSYGFFSIALPKGTYHLEIISNGYLTKNETVVLEGNKKINFDLSPESSKMEEVVVLGNTGKVNLRKPEMSVNKMTIQEIKRIPVVLGEVDLLKALTFLPGVTNAGDASSGINVRGGAVDQNLIMLDEATIYNTSHLFGFFSVFNPDAVKDLKLYKGGIPARFGGRVSSVLEIFQRDGNSKDFKVNGGNGLVSSRLLLEGPIKKDVSSFLVAGRGSYAHLFLKLFNNDNSAYFYDLNTKINYKINENNNLYLSGYFGRDIFSLNKSFVNTYGNTIANLRWNHLFSDKIFSNLSLIYSDYYYGLNIDFVGFDWSSGIKNYNLKYDFKHYLTDKIKLNHGLNSIYYDFNPGVISPNNASSGINYKQLDKKYATENALYIDVEHEITKKFNIEYGLRWSTFSNIGKQKVSLYENDMPVKYNSELKKYEKATAIDTKEYGSGEEIKSYNNFEPRISMAYQLDDKQSIKASYNRMAQYLQLVSNGNSPTPLDIWTPSGKYIKPQLQDQVALGYFRNISKSNYSLEIETYYKKTQNRLDYIDGADLVANNNIEQVILNGETKAYGLEFLFRKNTGKFRGWASYTLAKTQQKTAGRTSEEPGINGGKWYDTPYDKTHNLALATNYQYNDKWLFAANFTLQTGQPTTFANGNYQYNGIVIPTYNARNSDRLPMYHHLDVSATLTSRHNKNRRWQGEWVFSIYNLYNRRNATYIFFTDDDKKGNITQQLAIFGMVPAVTYNFKF